MIEEDIFGPIYGPWDVELAVVATLRLWMPEYLAEIERKRGLHARTIPRPPDPESYHGGADFDTWVQDRTPEVIVVVHPNGRPEYAASNGYTQAYNVEVGCQWVGSGSPLAEQPEDEARAVASHLGAASQLLVQQPTLGGLSERVILAAAPDVTLPEPDRRDLAQVVTGFEVWVPTIVRELAGPVEPNPPESPEYQGPEQPYTQEPTVQTTDVDIDATPI